MLNDMCMEKEAWVNAASKAIGGFMKTTGKQALISGAKKGAAFGAFSGFLNGGGTDANGNKQSRIGSTIKGAVFGGAAGGVLGGANAIRNTNTFKNTIGNARNQVNNWAKTKFPSVFQNKSASADLEELYTEKLAGAGLSMGATGGAIAGVMRGITKGYKKGGISGAIKSGINKGTAGALMGAGAGALLDRISAPKQEREQNPNATQNFNG